MLTHMFHRHIPNYSSPTISSLDPRQRNHPDNAETWRNVGGDMARQARLPAFSQFHWALWSYTGETISFTLYLQTPPSPTDAWLNKYGGSISFGADGVGQRGFWIIIRTWFQRPPACVYPLGLSTHSLLLGLGWGQDHAEACGFKISLCHSWDENLQYINDESKEDDDYKGWQHAWVTPF